MRWFLPTLLAAALVQGWARAEDVTAKTVPAVDVRVTGIKAVHRDGQTFVTWKDVAEGEAGGPYRYDLYRGDKRITQDNLAQAQRVIAGILNNSGKHYGHDLFMANRIDPAKPMATIQEGGQPLEQWTGLAVRTVPADGKSYYAVVATDVEGKPVSRIEPGQSATAEPVDEKVAPIAPVKTGDSKTRGRYADILKITGQQGLPLHVNLHASSSQGGPGSDHGDYYLFWGRPEWGYRDGLPWQFSVAERADGGPRRLVLDSRETMAHPAGQKSIETYWFGYYCAPQWATHAEPRAYDFTERRTLWVIDWVIRKYQANPERVYASGGSMGAWGSATFAFRHPEIFAAVYPNRPRTQQKGLPSLAPPLKKDQVPLMHDGVTSYYDRMDMVKFAAEHPGDLPFIGWCCGRRDGFATFKEQIDLVKALTAARHGFAFAWNDGDHSSGSAPMREVQKYYPADKFARNVSYPAFANSSLDDDLGSGEVEEVVDGKKARVIKDGVKEGGINLGFDWAEVADEPDRWSARVSNALAKADMTVDVTPRRCQKFKPRPGEKFKWTSSAGGQGEAEADPHGLVTLKQVVIRPGQATSLTISRP